MEAKARLLHETDCGSLLLARSLCPYITGCLLPSRMTGTHLEAKLTVRRGQSALELYVHGEDGGHVYHLPFVVDAAQCPDFVQALGEASALYLLTGAEHPAAYADGQGRTLYQRVYEGGMAVEVGERIRRHVKSLDDNPRYKIDSTLRSMTFR